jgi:hypothetical protein
LTPSGGYYAEDTVFEQRLSLLHSSVTLFLPGLPQHAVGAHNRAKILSSTIQHGAMASKASKTLYQFILGSVSVRDTF